MRFFFDWKPALGNDGGSWWCATGVGGSANAGIEPNESAASSSSVSSSGRN